MPKLCGSGYPTEPTSVVAFRGRPLLCRFQPRIPVFFRWSPEIREASGTGAAGIVREMAIQFLSDQLPAIFKPNIGITFYEILFFK